MAGGLLNRIIRQIEMTGPLPLSEYMHWCMADRKEGYYSSQSAFGADGDFITAPEISQMFGELIGVWAIKAWEKLGSPPQFNLVELGPGRGTLMKDLLRAAKVSESFLNAAQITLVETSEQLRTEQAANLSSEYQITWIDAIDDISDAPTVIIANEFLDVLPIHQYVKRGDSWHENAVGTDEHGKLAWQLGTGLADTASLPDGHEKEPDGSVFEISPAREAVVENIAQLVKNNKGAALFIDYGHLEHGFGDTFQAMKSHKHVDPLNDPGLSDLTSHVDFSALKNIILNKGLNVQPFMTQGDFLLAQGLLERAGVLGSGKSEAIQEQITQEAERLAMPDQMGELFKVFAFSSCEELWPFTD